MALALYRKYRPRTFAEIIGQEHVTDPLCQALRSGRLHHAYLFSGPRGCGKTSSARILARSLNCVKGPTPDPCGVCESCVALAPDGPGSIDVIEIDAASHGGVDDARDLRERAFFAPVSSRFKVYVIDEAHMVSPAGFNALLKLVEEPPDYVKFVFATTEPEKVLSTIKSRTHHYPFRLIPPGVLRPYLEQLCVAEEVTVQPPVFPLVVRAGGGSVRDALSVLDQLIAGAGPEGVTYARAAALLGVTDVALIDEMCEALAAGDGAAAYATIDRVAEAGHDPRRFAGDLLERLRDLIILQQVPDAAAKGLIGVADDELERMVSQADRFGAATLSRMADIMHTGLVDMRGTTAPRLVLELLTARMLLPGADDSQAALLQRMERMERRLTLAGAEPAPATTASETADPAVRSTGTTSSPRPVERPPAVQRSDPSTAPTERPPAAPTTAAPTTSVAAPKVPSSPPGALDAAAVRRIWDEVLTMVRRKSPRAAAVVREATVRDVDGDNLVLLFKHPFHAQALAAAPELLLDALYEILGGRWNIRCEVAGQSGVITPIAGTNGPAAFAASVPSADQPSAISPPATAAPATSTPTGGRRGRSESGAGRQRPAGGTDSEGASSGDSSSDVDEDWPTPAPLGGTGGATATIPATSRTAMAAQRAADGAAARVAPAEPSSAPSAVAPQRRPTARGAGAARAAARAAAGGRSGGAGNAGRAGLGDVASWSGDEEPPYDPEFDGPVRATDHIGFDPGDEPDDDADSGAVRATSEQQALDLLRQTLGAEKIDEIDTR
jgi:DNA polymerase-3 subunit gamma/tau